MYRKIDSTTRMETAQCSDDSNKCSYVSDDSTSSIIHPVDVGRVVPCIKGLYQ